MAKVKANGDCFRTALKVQRDKHPEWILVHGAPMGRSGQAEGVRYPHAFLQAPDGSTVFDPNLYEKGVDPYISPGAVYYALGDVRDAVKYSMAAAELMCRRKGHCGPWDKKLIKLGKKLGL